ncbi:MAG: SMC-Scp complex subunit ScpB, partial [Acidimicrobiales bacterium]
MPGRDLFGRGAGRVSSERHRSFRRGECDRNRQGHPIAATAEAKAVEAVLMVATEPVTPSLLAELLEIPVDQVEGLCAALAASYEQEGRGFVLARVAGGYRFQSHPD